MTAPERLRRVVVVGTTGSGKTTFAAALAAVRGLRHVELDSLHWGANWTPRERDTFRTAVLAFSASDGWVADGNYSAVRDILWSRADTLIWLDYPLPLILGRLCRRTVRRVITREELWHGNRERLLDQFRWHDSLFVWAVLTHARRRRDYPPAYTNAHFAHLRVVRLRSPRTAAAWLARVQPRHMK